MKRVGIRELKDKATTLLAANETLLVKRHDEPIGIYIPLKTKTRAEKLKILNRLGKTVAVAEGLRLRGRQRLARALPS